MSAPQILIPEDAVRAVFKHMKNAPSATAGNPASLSRTEMVTMVRKYFPECTLKPRSVDRLYAVCQIIGQLYADTDMQLIIQPDLGIDWSPHMVIIHENQATVVSIRIMPCAVYTSPETWQDYDAYARLPHAERAKIKLGLAAQKVLEQMPNVRRVSATTLVCIIGYGNKGPIKPKFRELKVFRRA